MLVFRAAENRKGSLCCICKKYERYMKKTERCNKLRKRVLYSPNPIERKCWCGNLKWIFGLFYFIERLLIHWQTVFPNFCTASFFPAENLSVFPLIVLLTKEGYYNFPTSFCVCFRKIQRESLLTTYLCMGNEVKSILRLFVCSERIFWRIQSWYYRNISYSRLVKRLPWNEAYLSLSPVDDHKV